MADRQSNGYLYNARSRDLATRDDEGTLQFLPKIGFSDLTPGVRYAGEPEPAQADPSSALNNELTQLQERVLGYERDLRTRYADNPDLPNAISDLQEQYNRKKAVILAKQGNLQQIDDLIKQGAINPQLGAEAKWRTILPEDTQRAMFPTLKEPKAIPTVTPGEFTGVEKRAGEFISGTPGWGKKEHADLLTPYFKFIQNEAVIQGVASYSELSPIQKTQINKAWDNMNSAAGSRWNPDDPGLRSVRSPGRLGQAAGRTTTPFSQAVTAAKPKSSGKLSGFLAKVARGNEIEAGTPDSAKNFKRPLDRETAASILKEVKGDKKKAREVAQRRGYEL